jgi:hypothetical protein
MVVDVGEGLVLITGSFLGWFQVGKIKEKVAAILAPPRPLRGNKSQLFIEDKDKKISCYTT